MLLADRTLRYRQGPSFRRSLFGVIILVKATFVAKR